MGVRMKVAPKNGIPELKLRVQVTGGRGAGKSWLVGVLRQALAAQSSLAVTDEKWQTGPSRDVLTVVVANLERKVE